MTNDRLVINRSRYPPLIAPARDLARWRITDTPTRLRHSVWTAPPGASLGLYGWRFQGTDDNGLSLVFDVYKAENGWHVHRAYDH